MTSTGWRAVQPLATAHSVNIIAPAKSSTITGLFFTGRALLSILPTYLTSLKPFSIFLRCLPLKVRLRVWNTVA